MISRDSGFATVDYMLEELPVSMVAIGPEAGLEDQTTYYWKVLAVDGFGARMSILRPTPQTLWTQTASTMLALLIPLSFSTEI